MPVYQSYNSLTSVTIKVNLVWPSLLVLACHHSPTLLTPPTHLQHLYHIFWVVYRLTPVLPVSRYEFTLDVKDKWRVNKSRPIDEFTVSAANFTFSPSSIAITLRTARNIKIQKLIETCLHASMWALTDVGQLSTNRYTAPRKIINNPSPRNALSMYEHRSEEQLNLGQHILEAREDWIEDSLAAYSEAVPEVMREHWYLVEGG
ncbi:hypothetical protein DFH08DRAFT_812358 [Mycena albidolilacea]|uniref:Uncharacterized protein n=1 Tax=Mycena albidolilacea TaxID=1033008 RepID=A0AAD6ZUY5_9AGAR|nr:hypothetical protein DFH08DRAFT_812358 [Mycena albidolilacea]